MTDLNEVIQKITDTIDDAAKHYGEHWDSAPVVVDHAAVAPALLEELARSTPGEIIAVPRVSEENITRHVRDLTMMVKLLVRTVRKYNPESQQAKDFMQYLQREGLISTSDILRASPGEALKDPK